MSGIEVVGLVFGAIPLVISAMEHYEQAEKATKNWWRIERAHKKDLRKLNACRRKLRLNLQGILKPLVTTDVVTAAEYQQLLDEPLGACWKYDNVQDALQQRLGECYDDYLDTLDELGFVSAKLCRALMVDDQAFLDRLETKLKGNARVVNHKVPSPRSSSSTPMRGGSTRDSTRTALSRTSFQIDRIKFAFGGPQREALVDEMEGYIQTLRDIVEDNDKVAAVDQPAALPKSQIPKHLLTFWMHADMIFCLLNDVWKCNCRSMHCAHLWLKNRFDQHVNLDLVLRYCPGDPQANVPWREQPTSIRLTERPSDPSVSSLSALLSSAQISGPQNRPSNTPTSKVSLVVVDSHYTTSVTLPPSTRPKTVKFQASTPSPTNSIVSSTIYDDIHSQGLCKMISSAVIGVPGRYASLFDNVNDRHYAVMPPSEHIAGSSSKSLAHILKGSVKPLARMKRYAFAHTLAMTHLQLDTTSWLKDNWTAEDVYFPIDSQSLTEPKVLDSKPYVLAHFSTSSPSQLPTCNNRFTTLGILLLELCFGQALEDNERWQSMGLAALKADLTCRQVVATKWLDEEVLGEAGEHFDAAVRWCLQQAPRVTQGGKWREEFASNVVMRLKRCCEI